MMIVPGRPAGSASAPWTEHLSGAAWMDLLLRQPGGAGANEPVIVTSATFSPGSRTHWHRHAGGQLLIIVSGEGWVGDRVSARRLVRAGDLVWTAPGEDHWHGASDASAMTHLAVTLGDTDWYDEPVTQEQA